MFDFMMLCAGAMRSGAERERVGGGGSEARLRGHHRRQECRRSVGWATLLSPLLHGSLPTKTSFGPDAKKQLSFPTNDLQKLFLSRPSDLKIFAATRSSCEPTHLVSAESVGLAACRRLWLPIRLFRNTNSPRIDASGLDFLSLTGCGQRTEQSGRRRHRGGPWSAG